MSALATKLRRLQREAGAAGAGKPALPPLPRGEGRGEDGSAPATSNPLASPRSTHTIDSLRRLLGVRGRAQASAPPAVRTRTAPLRSLPGTEIAAGVRYVEHFTPWPACSSAALDLVAFGIESPIASSQLKFFDTETTGLAGGTGTRAFMLGLGDWHGGGFRVRQLTLTTTGGETAMLDTFASWLGSPHLLVSYNGRCYDAPLLATRYRLARRSTPLATLPHLDLLYPTRRRYRGVWENCRLATIERRALGVVREDDLPGSEAPRAWRDWLQHGDATDLVRVAAHNRQDLCSLALLLQHLAD